MRLIGLYVPVIKALTVAMIATLLGLMIVEVVMRYVFLSSLIWAEEACRYLLIWSSFLAAVLAYERGELANVELFRQRLPGKARLMATILANALCVAFLAVLVWYGSVFAARVGGQPIPAMRFLLGDLFGPEFPVPRMFWVYVSLPLGMALLAIRMSVDLVGNVNLLLRGGDAESDPGARGA
ncbi:MAG: TRAP transporter small permease [Nitratireductor sp.]